MFKPANRKQLGTWTNIVESLQELDWHLRRLGLGATLACLRKTKEYHKTKMGCNLCFDDADHLLWWLFSAGHMTHGQDFSAKTIVGINKTDEMLTLEAISSSFKFISRFSNSFIKQAAKNAGALSNGW